MDIRMDYMQMNLYQFKCVNARIRESEARARAEHAREVAKRTQKARAPMTTPMTSDTPTPATKGDVDSSGPTMSLSEEYPFMAKLLRAYKIDPDGRD